MKRNRWKRRKKKKKKCRRGLLCVCGGFCPWVDGVFSCGIGGGHGRRRTSQWTPPGSLISSRTFAHALLWFFSKERGERERLLIWIGDDISHPTLEHRGRAGGRDRAALAWPCVASVWCNVLVGSQCASAFLSLSPLPLYLSLSFLMERVSVSIRRAESSAQ
jgi:hypothetical protein